MNWLYNIFKLPIEKFIERTGRTPEVYIELKDLRSDHMLYYVVAQCEFKRATCVLRSDAEPNMDTIDQFFRTFADDILRSRQRHSTQCASNAINTGRPVYIDVSRAYDESPCINFNDFCDSMDNIYGVEVRQEV